MTVFRRLLGALAILSASVVQAPAAYQFSHYDFARNPARVDNSLRVEMRGRAALRSYRFVGKVGGVNFESVVDLSDTELYLHYDPQLPDGSRAALNLDGSEHILPLYDWQLRPIVGYADSSYTAVVSIFGDGPEGDKYYYIDYHPAFEDTHLGVRLLQADILFIDPFTFSEAPAEDGEKIFMPGEAQEAAEEVRFEAAQALATIVQSEPYQSWVLTDTGLVPTVEPEGEFLNVRLQPYYNFWRGEETEETISFQEKLFEIEEVRVRAMPLADAYEAARQEYLNAPADSPAKTSALETLEELSVELDPLIAKFKALETELSGAPPEPIVLDVTGLTVAMSDAQDAVDRAAPFVADAVRTTAAYAALFRGVKAAHPEWAAFRDEVIETVVLPSAETPNQFSQ